MKNMLLGILAIILGLIIIAFPLTGLVAVSVITGLSVIFLAFWFIIAGVAEMGSSKLVGILSVILGIIALVIGIGLVFNPALLAFLASIVLYLAGILMIVFGVIALLGGTDAKHRVWGGVLGIILGIVYIILGVYASNPLYLGILIGIWLVLTGIFSFFRINGIKMFIEGFKVEITNRPIKF
jgi:membrane protein HdeD